ncbi:MULTISPECIES: heme-binding beta-barrel domain-containing protein [unclassified Devosia]|uniref:heme-binding beta-barrel domain-containing protein n=1 Tax=unclassified Devosia TaxID=196773 RepID=UPI0015F947D2|nr:MULTISPECIES: heme-binding beta-barrel domain-containing protein [unclassified Devosia]MBJ6988876.1 FABP family protein [Devosia sp. MC521]MBJ7578365.1 FABP family protein [Devosia sp. MC532]MBK1794894.1 FABP family protein [Devosia sp. WQ 349K1]QMW62227.1 FABP family protein [Devosia sp. MC521]
MLKTWLRTSFVALTMLTPFTAPALAQPELEKLQSYLGDWRGEGALTGGGRNEPFRCRLSVAQGVQLKVNYTGRCTLVNATLSISGTIAYNAAGKQYEAAMSSNAGFTGLAIGRQSGDRISFDLQEKQKDRAGSDVRIGSKINLIGETITVDFEVEFNDSGEVLKASVPFAK